MKNLGIVICIFGSLIAILFVPTSLMGVNTGWHYILNNIQMYRFINTGVLLLELILINGVGFALIVIGKKKMT